MKIPVMRCCCVALVVVASAWLPLNAADVAGQGLPYLVRANERFGRVLLERVHQRDPEHNVVVSPISLTIILAAIQNSSEDRQLCKEIGDAFGWGGYFDLGIPLRMLLAAFEEPERLRPAPPGTGQMPNGMPKGVARKHIEFWEESWITNAVLFRSRDPGSDRDLKPFAQEFVDHASKYFGMKFVDTGAANPTANDLRGARQSVGPLPQVSSKNDMWISSAAHLGTTWEGNTFSMSKPFTGEFRMEGGGKRQVEMITSELERYFHAATDSFEAVVLPCNRAYMVAVLPAPGKDIHELERDLANSPETLDAALKRQTGIVTMPTFHIVSEGDLRPPLEEMGIRQVFRDLGPLATIPGSHLTEVAQKIDVQVDKEGIRASAETVAGGVAGGIMEGTGFKMKIDRPFLFLIRDKNTNALLFLGAVMDPTQNH
ncbi:MAG: serpin family protein [Bryobacteraceae bacterium]